jgi:hypothetical protein
VSSKLDPKKIDAAFKDVVEQFNEAVAPLKGRQVRITAFYNGQACGKSRRNLEGTVQRIASAQVSDGCGLIIWLEGYRYGCAALGVDQWELIE